MGIYFNPGSEAFEQALRSKIYVDKTGLIACTNEVLGTEQKNICISRPRRFGKSMAANMLAAYYSKGCDSKQLFENLAIYNHTSFSQYLNQYHVIFLNMQDFWSRTHNIYDMISLLQKKVLYELLKSYPEFDYFDKTDLIDVLQDIYYYEKLPFIFIIDEWDCIFRESAQNVDCQRKYLDFLRNLLKDKSYVALAYMTGILPIKKYGTHSALNMFYEYSMMNPSDFAPYVGFTEEEVKSLCERYNVDFAEMQRWYDGYLLENQYHIYNPKSVVDAIYRKKFSSYWTSTETYEALKVYIDMNLDGLKDSIIQMLAGERCMIDYHTFQNDMTSFHKKDDVLTLLVHLGYLAYDGNTQEVYIPNEEVRAEFVRVVKSGEWKEVIKMLSASERLLHATLAGSSLDVEKQLDDIHMDATSILAYNDENSLSCVITLAYYSARNYYTLIRELPTGKGFADIVFLPRKNHLDKPAMIIELKWDHSANGAIKQVKNNQYVKALEEYKGNLLLVGINYDKGKKQHKCVIEKYSL